jgi:hypothetical protein
LQYLSFYFSDYTALSARIHGYLPDSVRNKKVKLTDFGFDENYRGQQYDETKHVGWLEWGAG